MSRISTSTPTLDRMTRMVSEDQSPQRRRNGISRNPSDASLISKESISSLRSQRFELKVRQSRNDFFKPTFLSKNEQTNSTLLLWYLRSTCFCLFFGRNRRHQKDITKLTDLQYLLYIHQIKVTKHQTVFSVCVPFSKKVT